MKSSGLNFHRLGFFGAQPKISASLCMCARTTTQREVLDRFLAECVTFQTTAFCCLSDVFIMRVSGSTGLLSFFFF